MKLLAILSVILGAACGPQPPEFRVGSFDAGAEASYPDVVWHRQDAPGTARRPPLESTGDQVRAKVDASGGRRVWAVLDPAAGDVRFTSFDCVLNGAHGVLYVSHAAPRSELISRAALVAREMRAMAPVFARGRAIPLPFEAPAKGLRARAWTYRGRDYLVLVNRTKDRQWKVPDEALMPTWRPLFAARRDPRELLKKHMDAYYLRPYQVLVLESRLRPKRLLGR